MKFCKCFKNTYIIEHCPNVFDHFARLELLSVFSSNAGNSFVFGDKKRAIFTFSHISITIIIFEGKVSK